MSRRFRIVLGIIVLTVSIGLLIWGYAPTRRETRIQSISPTQLQLPTPSSHLMPLELGSVFQI